MKDKGIIYLDNAATTPVSENVAKVIRESIKADFFNPSALYAPSVKIATDIKRVRDEIKLAMHAPDGELYFTSGGTEANNTALLCARKRAGSRVIIGIGEHDSVIAPANELKAQGFDVVFAPINADGSVNIRGFAELLDETVSLVSIMHASNETGAVNDVASLVSMTKTIAPKAIFHCDGVQAFGKIPVNLRALDVDLYSVSAHKLHGPKGMGALFVKKGASLKPLLLGGGQEKGMRSGTENYPYIKGFGEAVKNASGDKLKENISKITQYQEYLRKKLLEVLPNTVIITTQANSVPNVLTVAFENVRGEVLLHALERHGIYVGIGSACSSHHDSRFKYLLGLDEDHREGIVRMSMSEMNDIGEVDFVVSAIKREIDVLAKFKRI